MLWVVTLWLCPPQQGSWRPHLSPTSQGVLGVGGFCRPQGLWAQVDSALRSRQWPQAGPKEDLILQGAAGPLAPRSQDPTAGILDELLLPRQQHHQL